MIHVTPYGRKRPSLRHERIGRSPLRSAQPLVGPRPAPGRPAPAGQGAGDPGGKVAQPVGAAPPLRLDGPAAVARARPPRWPQDRRPPADETACLQRRLATKPICGDTRSDGSLLGPSWLLPLGRLGQHSLSLLHALLHAHSAIDGGSFREQSTRFLLIAGATTLHQHLRVASARPRSLDDDR